MKYEILYIAIFALLACALVFAAYKTHQAKVDSLEEKMTFVIDQEKEHRKFEKPIQKPEIESFQNFRDALFDYQMELMANDWATYGDIRIMSYRSAGRTWIYKRKDIVRVRVEMKNYDQANQIDSIIKRIGELSNEHLIDYFKRIEIEVHDENESNRKDRIIKEVVLTKNG